MKESLLYHCFSRTKKDSIIILDSILHNGFYLKREKVNIGWDDPDGFTTSKEIEINQYRLCLTSLDDDHDLFEHGKLFGQIGLGFKTDFIRCIGGFPVFYLPTPILNKFDQTVEGTANGVSLFYRLAELRAILDAIDQLPIKYQKILKTKVKDFQNTQGALIFIGNILYLTNRKNDDTKLHYYQQREWRIIAGSNPMIQKKISFDTYAISEFQGKPISSYIEEIIIMDDMKNKETVNQILKNHGLNVPIRCIKSPIKNYNSA